LSGWGHWKGGLGGGWSLRGAHPKKYMCLLKIKINTLLAAHLGRIWFSAHFLRASQLKSRDYFRHVACGICNSGCGGACTGFNQFHTESIYTFTLCLLANTVTLNLTHSHTLSHWIHINCHTVYEFVCACVWMCCLALGSPQGSARLCRQLCSICVFACLGKGPFQLKLMWIVLWMEETAEGQNQQANQVGSRP